MQKVYSINELVDLAVLIETNGAAFYLRASEKSENKETKAMFSFLSEEELHHKALYQEMLSNIDQSVNPGTVYSDEYHQYLKALIDNVVFTKNSEKTISALQNDAEVADYAIGKEKDSIIFYIEMKKFVPPSYHSVIDEIIEEEQLHVLKLVDIKEKIG